VEGNLNGTERVELKRSAVHVGDISTQRITVEDGAYLKGAIDIHKDAAKPAQTARPTETAKSYTATATGNASSSPSQPGLIPRS
jgi:cytoskeletal protein CcmA (bactofilin family)